MEQERVITDGHVPSILHVYRGYRWSCSCGQYMPAPHAWETVSQAAQSWSVHLDRE